MRLSRRDQALLALLIIMLQAIAFYRFVYAPANEEIRALTAANQGLELDRQRLTAIKDAPLPQDEAADQYDDLDKRLPREDEMIPLLTMLDEIIADCDLPFASLDYKGAEINPTGVQTLVFTVGVKGSVYQLLDLLSQLENAERLVIVGDISFAGVNIEAPPPAAGEAESSPPVYYIEPPGIPEAKLQRIKVEVVEDDTPEVYEDVEKPVAASLLADNYDMKLTIKSYYAADAAESEESAGSGESDSEKEAGGGAEGEV